MQNPELHHFAQSLLNKERELCNSGYYTFVHGQQRKYYLMEKIYTLLWEIKCGKKISSDYVFPYFRKPITDETELLKESARRKELLTTYVTKGYPQPEVLYLNWALWTNRQSNRCNTAEYITRNENARGFPISLEEIFKFFECEELHKIFKKEINELAQEYENASKYGNALIIGIPKEKAHELVYFARRGGYHNDSYGSCNNIQNILNEVAQQKIKFKNEEIFCMPMTFDMALNPESGIRVFPLITGTPEKLNELKTKEDNLFEKIRTVVCKEKEAKLAAEEARIAKEFKKQYKPAWLLTRDLMSTVQN